MPTMAPSRLLRAKEVAHILGVDPARVRELVASGDLPSVRLGAQGWHRFRLEDHPVLFSGDTLFPGGPGTTKFEGGDFSTIIRSIEDRLFKLPADTIVLPGHGDKTTIGAERPHLQEWVDRGW